MATEPGERIAPSSARHVVALARAGRHVGVCT